MPQDPGNQGPQDFDMQRDPGNPGPQNVTSRKTLEIQDLNIWICGETLETGLCSTKIFRADSTLTHVTIQVTQL